MECVRGIQHHSRRTGAGKGSGDLCTDVPGFADTQHDYFSPRVDGFFNQLDRAGEIFIEPLLESLQFENFTRAVELIKEAVAARGKVVVLGVGKSGHIGAKIAATLTSTGSPAMVLDSSNALHGDLGMVADGDVVL